MSDKQEKIGRWSHTLVQQNPNYVDVTVLNGEDERRHTSMILMKTEPMVLITC
jgi:hypothetical protein